MPTVVNRTDTFEQWRTKTNTISTDLGTIADLSANITNDGSLVTAINELQSDIGVVGSLSTFAATDVVGALNELKTGSSVTISGTKTFAENVNIATGKAVTINGTSVLNSTTLGSGVVNSSLTAVGTIGTGTWQGTIVSPTYGGTGVNNGSRTITLNAGNLTLTAQSGGSSVTVPSTGTLATLAGTETLTGKTVNLTSNTLTGTIAQFNTALSDDDFVGVTTAATISNKSIALGSNTVTGTLAQFNSALTDADFASLDGSEVLTNKTLTDSNTLFQNNSVNSKKAKFDLGSISTSTTRTLTLQDANGTVALLGNTLNQFASTSSSQLASVISDETGTGALVFANTPTLVTPVLGVASATSINKVAITAPATSATLTVADGKTLTASNTLTLTGTDGSSVAFGAGGTVVYTSNNITALSTFSSADLAGRLTDETGTGAAVFANTPSLITPAISSGGATFSGSTGATVLKAATAAGSTTITMPAATGTMALTSDIGNGTLTLGSGDGIVPASATFSANQSGNASYSIEHAIPTGASASTRGTNGIASITTDKFGHITGATTATFLTSSTGVASITGTTYQVNASGSTGSITLSLPQDIHNSAKPTFAGATLGNIKIGVTGDNVINTVSGNLDVAAAINSTNVVAITSTLVNASKQTVLSVNNANTGLGGPSARFTVDSSGNVAIAGTLNVLGTTTFSTISGSVDFATQVTGKTYYGSLTDGTTTATPGDGTAIKFIGANGLTATVANDASGAPANVDHVTFGISDGGIANAKLANSSVTVTAGTGLSGGGTVSLGGTAITLTNAGVTSAVAGNAITVSGATGAVTINHADTSSVADLSSATNTFITAQTYDTYGHVQARTTGTVDFTVAANYAFQNLAIGADSEYTWGTVNTNTTQTAESSSDTLTIVRGLTGTTAGIDLYTNTVAGADAIKIAHADTSTLSGAQAAGTGNAITSVTVDEMGHVTAVGSGAVVTALTGTTNQVNVSGSTGSVTLSLPQSIHTGAEPTFAGATLGNIRVGVTTDNTINTSTGNLTIVSTGGTTTLSDNVVVSGNLTVNGTTTTVNSTTLDVVDLNITVGKNATTAAAANGAGLTVGTYASNPTMLYTSSSDRWVFNRDLQATNFVGNASTVTNGVYTTDSGTVSNTMLAGSIPNSKLASSTISGVSLGSNLYTLTIGSGLSGTSYNGSANTTIAVDSTVALRADTHYIGTTAVTLNRSSANLALTGISSVTLPGSTSGSVQIIPAAIAGTGTVLTLPATTGTVITTGDSGTVSNTMIANLTIANGKLANSAITIAGTSTSLGGSIALDTITGLSGTGIVKRTATNTLAIATSGTDYAPATSGSALLYGNGAGGFSNTTIGTGLTFSTGTLSLTNTAITIAGTSTSLGGSITLDTITGLSTTGLIKRTGANTLAVAVSGSDYAPATSGTSILYGNGSGGFSSATIGAGLTFSGGTLSSNVTSGSSILYGNGSGGFSNVTVGTGLTFSGGTLSIPQAIGTSSNVQFGAIGVGVANDGSTYKLDVTGNTRLNGDVFVPTGKYLYASTGLTGGISFTADYGVNIAANIQALTSSFVIGVSGTRSLVLSSGGSSSSVTIAHTSGNVTVAATLQAASLGIGTTPSGVAGEIRATDNITAYYTSDERLKTNVRKIENALNKISQIDGVIYDWTDDYKKERGDVDGYFIRDDNSGIIAQQVEKVFPNVVANKDNGYKAVRYELLVPLLIEAIKELKAEIEVLKQK